MFTRILFSIFIIILSVKNIYAQSQDGLLKNGRSVSYYSQKGQWQRELEPEENEFVQICIAKALNCFGKVQVAGYTRYNRYSIDAEDLLRNRKDDQAGIPFNLQGTISFSNAENSRIHIQVDENPVEIKATSSSPIRMNASENALEYWKLENYSTTTTSGEKYQGPAFIIAVGNFTPVIASNTLSVKGNFISKSFLQTNHIVIRILAPEEQALEIMKTMDQNRLNEALKYAEKWP